MMQRRWLTFVLTISWMPCVTAAGGEKWVATWTAAMQGTYAPRPAGPMDQQPDLVFALPKAATDGAANQTLRMIVKPDLWGDTIRLRLSNTFGPQPLKLRSVTVGLQEYGANIVGGTMTRVTFNNGRAVVLAPGQEVFSDEIRLKFVDRRTKTLLRGRNLAVSLAVDGSSGPMTYHAYALTTSYLSPSSSGDHSGDEMDTAFPYTTTSWFFVSAVDVRAPAGTSVVVALGDSITDGVFSTLGGDDRWPNFLSRRLHAAYGDKISVVNQGIGGSRVVTRMPRVSATMATVDRLERDVFSVSGVTAVVWLEGINDLLLRTKPADIIEGYKQVVQRLHAARIKVIGATVISALKPGQDYENSPLGVWAATIGGPQVDAERRELNAFIRNSGLFDSVADMDAATLNPITGALKESFVPSSTAMGAPLRDYVHPNRAGYQAMAGAIDIGALERRYEPQAR